MLKLGQTGTWETLGYIYSKPLISPPLQMNKSVASGLSKGTAYRGGLGKREQSRGRFSSSASGEGNHKLSELNCASVSPKFYRLLLRVSLVTGNLFQSTFASPLSELRCRNGKENRMELHLWGMRGRWVSRWTSSTHNTDLREAVIHPESTAQSLLCVSPWIEMLRYHRAGGWLSGAEQKVSLHADISTFTFRPVRQVLKRQPKVKKQ